VIGRPSIAYVIPPGYGGSQWAHSPCQSLGLAAAAAVAPNVVPRILVCRRLDPLSEPGEH
jgi:hypothetical protein